MGALKARARAIAIAIAGLGHAYAADWMQFGYDAAHSGSNPLETAIDHSNVASLVELVHVDWSPDDSIEGAAVFAASLPTAMGVRDVLFVGSGSGSLYALDAHSGATLWSRTFSGSVSIAASPAIDPDRTYVYMYGGDGNVHKYRIADGEESIGAGWPEPVTLKPSVEHGASSLAIATTSDGHRYLYAVTNGYMGDGGDYQGHLTTIDLDTGTQTVFNALCSNLALHFILNGAPGVNDCASQRAGIWGRPGATFDASTDRVYVATGNGNYDAEFGGFDWGDSLLALAADGTAADGVPLDSYTPTNYEELDLSDIDLGSGSLAIIGDVPGSSVGRLGVLMGKDQILRLLALDDLSGAGGPRHIGGELPGGGTSPGWVCKCSVPQPAIWRAPDGTVWVYAVASYPAAYQVVVDTAGQPSLQLRWTSQWTTTSPVVANGIVFAASAGVIYAFDAITGETLWSSSDVFFLRWNSPIVVNGRVYLTTGNGVYIYGPDRVFADGFE